jgi:hypothetical protein
MLGLLRQFQHPCVEQKAAPVSAAAVFAIPRQGMPVGGGLGADLVGPPGVYL